MGFCHREEQERRSHSRQPWVPSAVETTEEGQVAMSCMKKPPAYLEEHFRELFIFLPPSPILFFIASQLVSLEARVLQSQGQLGRWTQLLEIS